MTVYATARAGERDNLVDVYLAVVRPDGAVSFLRDNLEFTRDVVPVIRGWRVSDYFGPVLDLPVQLATRALSDHAASSSTTKEPDKQAIFPAVQEGVHLIHVGLARAGSAVETFADNLIAQAQASIQIVGGFVESIPGLRDT